MKILLLFAAAGVALFASSCRTVPPLDPMTMMPTTGALHSHQVRHHDPRVCSPGRVTIIGTK